MIICIIIIIILLILLFIENFTINNHTDIINDDIVIDTIQLSKYDKSIIDTIYPVGSVIFAKNYISKNIFNKMFPNTTWKLINNNHKYLGQGSYYVTINDFYLLNDYNNSGVSGSNTINSAQLPKHTHKYNQYITQGDCSGFRVGFGSLNKYSQNLNGIESLNDKSTTNTSIKTSGKSFYPSYMKFFVYVRIK